ncbi:MAG: hypothetical protein M3Y48_07820 [Actinomycetota bacterium]|nr:hypothetical protein [Actinomycetota bacterium]
MFPRRLPGRARRQLGDQVALTGDVSEGLASAARASSVGMVDTSPAARPPLTPGEALVKLFLDNADRGCHADNDVFVEELLKRRRAIQGIANPGGE